MSNKQPPADQAEQESDPFIEAINQAAEEVKAVQGSPIHILTGKPAENRGHRCALVAGSVGFAIIHEGRPPEGPGDNPIVEVSGSTVVDCSKVEGEGDDAAITDKDGNILDRYDISVTFFSTRMIPKMQQALQAASSLFFHTGARVVSSQVMEKESEQAKDPAPDNITGFPEQGKN